MSGNENNITMAAPSTPIPPFVNVKFSLISPITSPISYPIRNIGLPTNGEKIVIGRASKSASASPPQGKLKHSSSSKTLKPASSSISLKQGTSPKLAPATTSAESSRTAREDNGFFPFPQISRHHGYIYCKDGYVFYTDNQSKWGSKVNGLALKSQTSKNGLVLRALEDGDELSLADPGVVFKITFNTDELKKLRPKKEEKGKEEGKRKIPIELEDINWDEEEDKVEEKAKHDPSPALIKVTKYRFDDEEDLLDYSEGEVVAINTKPSLTSAFNKDKLDSDHDDAHEKRDPSPSLIKVTKYRFDEDLLDYSDDEVENTKPSVTNASVTNASVTNAFKDNLGSDDDVAHEKCTLTKPIFRNLFNSHDEDLLDYSDDEDEVYESNVAPSSSSSSGNVPSKSITIVSDFEDDDEEEEDGEITIMEYDDDSDVEVVEEDHSPTVIVEERDDVTVTSFRADSIWVPNAPNAPNAPIERQDQASQEVHEADSIEEVTIVNEEPIDKPIPIVNEELIGKPIQIPADWRIARPIEWPIAKGQLDNQKFSTHYKYGYDKGHSDAAVEYDATITLAFKEQREDLFRQIKEKDELIVLLRKDLALEKYEKKVAISQHEAQQAQQEASQCSKRDRVEDEAEQQQPEPKVRKLANNNTTAAATTTTTATDQSGGSRFKRICSKVGVYTTAALIGSVATLAGLSMTAE